mmetsp:Transcript_118848/g.296406  ORF Transcript_118848/g.296406 Transcript_118848/m.296406 type:complete len:677 (-) Transcript_118848:541-2571(-)
MENKVEADAAGLAHAETAPSSPDLFGSLTVGHVVGLGQSNCRLQPHDQLGDLADALASSGRTAMAVVDNSDDGKLVSLVTANDVMRAYFEGMPPSMCLSDWWASGSARAPPEFLHRLVVRPWTLLTEAAEKMVANALAGDCACHHAVIQGESGQLYGVVSSHDLVRALCHGEEAVEGQQVEEISTKLTVRDVMKTKERVFTCLPSSTMRDALKILLVTQQNSVLVVDAAGTSAFGFITTRDVVKAFADATPNHITIEDWLCERVASVDRTIPSDARLADAAVKLSYWDVDHLVVVHPGSREAVGVLSSLDVLLRTKPNLPFLCPMPLWIGPTVAEVLTQHKHLTDICPRGATLGTVAELLIRSGRTATIIELGGEGLQLGLLTENDIVRAFADCRRRNDAVEGWMVSSEPQHVKVPLQLQVEPATSLMEAASLMLSVAEPGRTCHHLVVKELPGDWLGVFSALDVARALHGLPSELDVARLGADDASVGMVMKPLGCIPTCLPTDTIRFALSTLDISGQNAVLVEDKADKVLGLITPRCALEALVGAVPYDTTVGDWMRMRKMPEAPREVVLGTRLADAATIMTTHGLHHLLVVEHLGEAPVGVLSALDLVRGVVSMNSRCPFVSLGWLWRHSGAASASATGSKDVRLKGRYKRPASPAADDADVSSPVHNKPRNE